MAKKKSKRINPNRKPAHMTEAKLEKIKAQVTDEAMMRALRLVLWAIIDKRGETKEQVKQLSQDINYVSDSITRGFLKWEDIDKVLDEEYEIIIDLR